MLYFKQKEKEREEEISENAGNNIPKLILIIRNHIIRTSRMVFRAKN